MMIKTVRQTVTEASDVTDNTDDTSTSSTDSARERREGPRSSTGTREREREMNECRWTGGDRGKTIPPKYGELRGDIREKEIVMSRNQPLCVTSAGIVGRNRDKNNERDSTTTSEKEMEREKEKEKGKDRSFAGISSSANCTSSLIPLLPVPRTALVGHGHGHQKSKSVVIYDTSFNLGTKVKQTVNPMFANKLNLDTTFTPVAGKPPQLTPRRKLNSPQQ